jgi:hypothetical protein
MRFLSLCILMGSAALASPAVASDGPPLSERSSIIKGTSLHSPNLAVSADPDSPGGDRNNGILHDLDTLAGTPKLKRADPESPGGNRY